MITIFGSATDIIYTIILVEVEKMRFCDKLVNLRKKNNFSQETLAEKLNVSRQAVSKWESGSTYPDMEKMLLLCNILNCTLEELMDDGVIKTSDKGNSKFNLNNWFNDFLKYITNSYNMFCNMVFKDKIKCLLEMAFIFVVIYFMCKIIYSLVNIFLIDLFVNIPKIGYVIDSIFEGITTLILAVLGIIVFLHLFKIRYLDYYVTIEDRNVKEQVIEDPIEKDSKSSVFSKKEQDRIIIRDPKHSSFSFFEGLSRFIVFWIKVFTVFFGVCVCFGFVLFIICDVFLIMYLKYGVIFFGLLLAFLGCSFIAYLLIEFIYNFVFNRVHHYKRGFIMFVTSLVLVGIGSAVSFNGMLDFKYVTDNSDLKYVTDSMNIEMTKNMIIYNVDDVVIDNDRKDIKVEITHLKSSGYDYDVYGDGSYYFYKNVSPASFFEVISNDIKNKKIRNYNDAFDVKVKIYISDDNYKMLTTHDNTSYEDE